MMYRPTLGVRSILLSLAAAFVGLTFVGTATDMRAFGQEAGARKSVTAPQLTLIQVLVATYQTNPALQAQRASLRGTDEEIPQALSNWRPTVTINESFGVSARASDLPVASTVRSDRVDQNINLSFSQPVFRGFRTLNQTARARNNIRAARATLRQVEQATLLSAVEAYTAVVRDKAVLELNHNNERVLSRQLEATRSRFEVGELTRTDVAQSESRWSSSTAGRIAAAGDLVGAQAEFVRVTGMAPGELADVGALERFLPASLELAVETARHENPAVLAARYREAAAQENVDLVEGELLPSLTVDGSISHNAQLHGADTDITAGSITANLRVPLYQSGSVYSRVRQAKQVASQRLLELADAEREAVRQATESWEALETARARIVSFTSEVGSQEIALEGVRQESQVGARTVLDELDAEQELLDAQVSLVRAQRDEAVAAFRLLSALGWLIAEHLGLPVGIYDPGVHLEGVDHLPIGTGIN